MSDIYLVSGGAGFIGSNIVHKLVEMGRTVRVFDNFSTGHLSNLSDVEDSIEVVEGDLRYDADVQRAVKGVSYIMHLAALPSVARSVEDPASTHDVNINGILRMLLAARENKVRRFVFSSSSSVYGDTEELPKHEAMRPQPLSPYALSKLTGEHYCRMFHSLYGLETVALRYFNVFGPRQDPASDYAAVIPLFVNAFRERRQPHIYGDGEQTRDFTFVDDVVRANLRGCEADAAAAGRAYNVAWGNRTSVNELANTIAELMGVNCEPVYEPPRAGDVRDSQADASLAEQYLQWKPEVQFELGLRQTVDWFLHQS